MKNDKKSPENDQKEINDLHEDLVPEIQEEKDTYIDYDLVMSGPLYVDPRHIKPGHKIAFVADRPGEIESYKRYGYNIVLDEFNVGDNQASKTTRFGSAVTVQSKCGALLVLMEIKDELHAKLMAYQASKNKERIGALGKIEGVADHFQRSDGVPLGEFITRRK